MPIYWLSLAGVIVTALHNYVLADVSLSEVVGPFALFFSALVRRVMISLPTAEEREGEEEEGEFVLTKEGKDFSFFFLISSFVFRLWHSFFFWTFSSKL